MPEYHASLSAGPFRWGANTAGPICDIRTGPTDYPIITEISGTVDQGSAAIGFVFGIGRPATLGVAKANSISFVSGDGSSPLPGLTIGTDWTTVPTVPTRFFRRMPINASSAGQPQFRFLFPAGLSLAPSSSMMLWVILTSSMISQTIGNVDINITVDA